MTSPAQRIRVIWGLPPGFKGPGWLSKGCGAAGGRRGRHPARLYNGGSPDFTPMPEKSPAARSPDSSLLPRRQALGVLCMTVARSKASAARALYQAMLAAGGDEVFPGVDEVIVVDPALPVPGRPALPDLVPPQKVERRRSLQTEAGRAAMIHALCHIEFNAINLALDAVWRFPGMPPGFYRDWLRVADEEALHFT